MRRTHLVAILLAWYFSVYHADSRMWLGPMAERGPFASLKRCMEDAAELQWHTARSSWRPLTEGSKTLVLWTSMDVIVGLCEWKGNP